VSTKLSAVDVARALLDAFTAADLERMRSYLADDLRAEITNAQGGVDEVRSADGYIGRVEAMDLPSANFRIEVTQAVTVRPDLAMVMVEINAARGGRTLHNFATHLLSVRDEQVHEWWMVEALPAESEAFWSA
jgi:SnoaL-like protein